MTTQATTRRTQEERKAESERRIIRAARNLFASQGYMRTTLAEVGKAAGYTGGLVSHRFGSKEGLLRAVVQRATTRFFEDQLQPVIDQASGRKALEQYIEIYLAEVGARESHVRSLYVIMGEALGAVPEIRDEISSLNQGFRGRVQLLVERGQRTGEFRAEVDAAAAALLIIGLLRGVTMQALADPTAVDLEGMVPMIQAAAINPLL